MKKTDSISFADIIGRFCIRTVRKFLPIVFVSHLPISKSLVGFLLDMGLMNVATPELPKFNLDMPNMTKDYNQLFRLNTDITYSQGFTNSFLRLLTPVCRFWIRIWLGIVFFPQFMQMDLSN